MTDYYPLIARAVVGLPKSTGETRRALYERARAALLAQLRSLDPPLAENEINRERLLLEEAIRKVQAEAARQQRAEPSRPNSAVKDRAPETKPGATAEETSVVPEAASDPGAAREGDKASSAGAQWVGQFRTRDRERAETAAAQALKGFRDLVAEVRGEASPLPEESPHEPSAAPETPAPKFAKPPREPVADPGPRPESSKPRRQSWSSPPAGDMEADRFEPRIDPHGPRQSRREGSAAEPLRLELPAGPPRSAQARQFSEFEQEPERERRGSAKALISAFLGVLIVVGIALALYWQRDRLRSVFVRSPVTQAQREATPSRPKISDRVGQAGQPG